MKDYTKNGIPICDRCNKPTNQVNITTHYTTNKRHSMWICNKCDIALACEQVENFHTITVKYLSATNTKGSRIKLIDTRFDQSITIPFDYTQNSVMETAARYLLERGANVVGQTCDLKNDCILIRGVNGTFTPLKNY